MACKKACHIPNSENSLAFPTSFAYTTCVGNSTTALRASENSSIKRCLTSLKVPVAFVLSVLLATFAMTQSTFASCGDYLHSRNTASSDSGLAGQKNAAPVDMLFQNETQSPRHVPCHGPECKRGPMPFAPVIPVRISTDHQERCFLELTGFRTRDELSSALVLEDALLPPNAPSRRIDYPPEA